MLEITAMSIETMGVKHPEKIEAAIIEVLAREHITIAASQEILKSTYQTILRRTQL